MILSVKLADSFCFLKVFSLTVASLALTKASWYSFLRLCMAQSSTSLLISLSNYLKFYSTEFSYFLSRSLNCYWIGKEYIGGGVEAGVLFLAVLGSAVAGERPHFLSLFLGAGPQRPSRPRLSVVHPVRCRRRHLFHVVEVVLTRLLRRKLRFRLVEVVRRVRLNLVRFLLQVVWKHFQILDINSNYFII